MIKQPSRLTPTLHELGLDLLRISSFQRTATLVTPFACFAFYLLFAHFRLWVPAVLTVMYLSFVTYGSLDLPRPCESNAGAIASFK
jgi:hypothetical protein